MDCTGGYWAHSRRIAAYSAIAGHYPITVKRLFKKADPRVPKPGGGGTRLSQSRAPFDIGSRSL